MGKGKMMTVLRRRAVVFLFAALMAWPVTYLIFRDWGNWEFVRVPGREYWIDHAADGFAGGSGGWGDPYVIETAEQLALVAKRVNEGGAKGAHFHISSDIDLSGRDWVPIGTRENPFTGHLESTGAVVSNLTIRGDRDGQGLVGVMEQGRLSSVTLESVDVEGRDRVGGLVGDGDYTYIENCGVSGSVRGRDRVGGLAGYLDWNFCKFNLYRGEVTGREEVGGLVGRWAKESRKWSGCEGGMASASSCASIWNSARVFFSGVVGRVSGERWVGGIVGRLMCIGIREKFFYGEVKGKSHFGLILGEAPFADYPTVTFYSGLVWHMQGMGVTFFLKNGELFAELGGGAGVVSVVGTEGATLLQAAVEGRIPEDLSVFGNRVRYLEVKRTAEWPESAAVSLGEEGYQPAVRFLGNMFFNVEGSTVKTSLDDEHYGFYAPRGLYCIPCVKFLDDDTLDVTWVLIRVV